MAEALQMRVAANSLVPLRVCHVLGRPQDREQWVVEGSAVRKFTAKVFKRRTCPPRSGSVSGTSSNHADRIRPSAMCVVCPSRRMHAQHVKCNGISRDKLPLQCLRPRLALKQLGQLRKSSFWPPLGFVGQKGPRAVHLARSVRPGKETKRVLHWHWVHRNPK